MYHNCSLYILLSTQAAGASWADRKWGNPIIRWPWSQQAPMNQVLDAIEKSWIKLDSVLWALKPNTFYCGAIALNPALRAETLKQVTDVTDSWL